MEVENILQAIFSDDIAMKFRTDNKGPYIPEVFAAKRMSDIVKVKRWLDTEATDVQKEIIMKRAKEGKRFASIARDLNIVERKAKMIYDNTLENLDITLKKDDAKKENKLFKK